VPLELSPFLVRRALAELRAEDREAAVDVEGALEWLGGRESEADPLVLSRYELQRFLWYELPRKWLVPFESKLAVADALAGFLDRVGAAPAYAELCRSDDTRSLLAAWEEGDPDAFARLERLLERSGLEPPATPSLVWDSVMGSVEARLREEAALALELAVEDGRLLPGQPGFERRQVAYVEAFLREPRAELDGQAPLAVIHEERIERWARRGGGKRRQIVGLVAPELSEPAPVIASAAIEDALEPLVWLLGLASDGLELTQTGALNRALVRAAVARYPHWWHELGDMPYREDEVAALYELHELARRMRLLRRKGRKLFLTARGAALRNDPPALLEACAETVLSSKPFAAAVQELAAALLLAEPELEWDELDARVYAAIVDDGWSAAGEPPEPRDVSWTIADLVGASRALGFLRLIGRYPAPRRLAATEAGRLALRLALRALATGPAETIL
jgi:hypothetical protein